MSTQCESSPSTKPKKIWEQLTPENWWKNAYCSTKNPQGEWRGEPDLVERCRVSEFCCLEGWLRRVYGSSETEPYRKASEAVDTALRTSAGVSGYVAYNDSETTKFEDILALVKLADV